MNLYIYIWYIYFNRCEKMSKYVQGSTQFLHRSGIRLSKRLAPVGIIGAQLKALLTSRHSSTDGKNLLEWVLQGKNFSVFKQLKPFLHQNPDLLCIKTETCFVLKKLFSLWNFFSFLSEAFFLLKKLFSLRRFLFFFSVRIFFSEAFFLSFSL